MSDILAAIDGTLADWNGSADSMRWRPDGGGPDIDLGPAARDAVATPMGQAVARLMYPEAFRMRDEFERAMQRLVTTAGTSDGDDVERLRERVMQMASSTGLSVAGAAGHLARTQPATPTWRLDPAVWPNRDFVLDLSGVSLTPGLVVLVDGVTEMERLRIIEGPLRGPWRVRPVTGRPSKLDARYHQRQKNRRKRRR